MIGMTLKKPTLQMVENLEQISQNAADAVSDALPKIAERARKTGRHVADIATSTADRVAHDPKVKAATAAVMSADSWQTAGRGFIRFARRRPALVVLGGVAVVSLVLVLSRRGKSAPAQATDGDAIGEGSYEGAREYHDRTRDFLKSEGGNVTRRAKEAEQALQSSERTALEAAEEEGRRHARS